MPRHLPVLPFGLFLVLLFAACTSDSAQRQVAHALPTLAQLPTLTATDLSSPPTSETNSLSSTPAPASTTSALTPAVVVASLAISPTPSQTITPTLTRTPLPPPLEITFEGVYPLAWEFRRPVGAALEANRSLLGVSRWTVSAYRDGDGWAKITLVPSEIVENAWANVETVTPVEIIARQTTSGQWDAFLVGSPDFAAILPDIPRSFADYVSPLALIDGEYKFPWQSGQSWWAVQGWHDGSALDFQPGPGARFAVLAAQSGRLREICSDGYQSLVQIQHADGRSTYYLHVTLALSARRRLLDHTVRRGQYLGELIRQDHFLTPCGRGYSRHLHFVVSDRSIKLEGIALETIAASASCCAHPPAYSSTNVRVDEN